MTYIVKPNQSIPDIIIQATGSLEAGMQFCNDNNVSISDTPAVGALMIVSDVALAMGDAGVLQYLAQNGIVVGTLNAIVAPPLIGPIKHRTLTIDHTMCGGSDSIDFPVLVSINDAILKTLTNGGHVNNSSGYDIQFFADEAETTKLNWEVEHYDGTTGTLVAWVKIPTVSHSMDTVFYMQYGEVTISTFQGGGAGSVWDTDFKMVQHFPDGTTLSVNDATTNGNNGTITGATAYVGIVNGSANFASSGADLISVIPVGTSLYNTSGTFSGWINTTINNSQNQYIWGISGTGGSVNGVFLVLNEGKLNVYTKPNTPFEQWIAAGTSVVADGDWHHVAITFNSNALCTLYVDGAVDGSVTNGVFDFAANTFRFGLSLDGFWQGYVGDIDEFRASDMNRSADWIATEYNSIKNASFITIGTEY